MKVKQSIPKELRFTVADFNRRFPTDAACLDELMKLRFPDGITYCEKCEQDRKHYRITGRPVYSCDYCGTQVSPMAGTIFEKSSTSLRLWFYAMYLMASHSLRHLREADSARDWRNLQNRVAHVQADSLVAVRTRYATGGT